MPKAEDDRFARVLAALVAEAGMTEYAIAKAAGIPNQTVASIRAGAVPRLDTMEKLLLAGGQSWHWFAEQMIAVDRPKGKARGK